MAGYKVFLSWSRFPYYREEFRIIDGKEELCLVLPIKRNFIKRGRQGHWVSMFYLDEVPPNEFGQSHRLRLAFPLLVDYREAKAKKLMDKTQGIGAAYVRGQLPPEDMRNGYDNSDATFFDADGCICLEHIPESAKFVNRPMHELCVRCMLRQSKWGESPIYLTGVIVLDEIPPSAIQLDELTGKHYVLCRIMKTEYTDRARNTHMLFAILPNGDEMEIGAFREWKQTASNQARALQLQDGLRAVVGDAPQRRDDMTIDGLDY